MNDFIELKDPLQASIFKDLIDHSSWSICTRDFYDYCTKGFGLRPSGWRWSIELAQLQSRCSLKSIHHLRHTWVLAVTSFRGAKTKKKKGGFTFKSQASNLDSKCNENNHGYQQAAYNNGKRELSALAYQCLQYLSDQEVPVLQNHLFAHHALR